MAGPQSRKTQERGPEGHRFEIELGGVDREIYEDGAECFEVAFTCSRPNESFEATVTINVAAVTTLDLIPRALGLLHTAFAALAEQTQAWDPGP